MVHYQLAETYHCKACQHIIIFYIIRVSFVSGLYSSCSMLGKGINCQLKRLGLQMLRIEPHCTGQQRQTCFQLIIAGVTFLACINLEQDNLCNIWILEVMFWFSEFTLLWNASYYLYVIGKCKFAFIISLKKWNLLTLNW